MTFARQSVPGMDWAKRMETLTNLHVSSAGTIEDDGIGMLQVSRAGKKRSVIANASKI